MIQFSIRQLDTIKTPVLDKLILLYKFYLISFLVCLVAAIVGLAYLIMSSIHSCSYQQIHIFTIISVVFYLCLVGDMLLSEKATLRFFNQNCNNTDLAQNTTFKAFLQSVERLRYYANQKEISVFQVREVLWNTLSIPYSKFFFLCQIICWILYGISFFFAVNFLGKGCVHKYESLAIFIIYLYHNFWFVILVGFAVVVSISAVLFLPFMICAYFRYNDKSEFPSDPVEQQKAFLSTQLENFKYDSTKAKDTLCAICLEDFQADCPVKRTKCCKSIYHQICIQEWVANSITCPNCRKSPFTKNKGSDLQIESVVPINDNQQNNEQNNIQIQPNQVQNPINGNQNNENDIENQNQNNDQNQNQNVNINEQLNNIQVEQADLQQNKVDEQNIEAENPQEKQMNQESNQIIENENTSFKNIPQNNNSLDEQSYIIQFSDKSGMPSRKNSLSKNKISLHEINIDNNLDGEPIQIFEDQKNKIDNMKEDDFQVQIAQNDLSSNNKQQKKHDSINTLGENFQINNYELQGQRLTIHNNIESIAANSTQISTQKVPISTKQIGIQSHNPTAGQIFQYDVCDFENMQEFKEDL